MEYDENLQRLIDDIEKDSRALLETKNKKYNCCTLKKEEKDVFYCNLYNYYYNGGFVTIITSNILEIFSLIFGIFFMTFIFVLLDWGKILKCGNQNEIQDCGDISLYINPHIPNVFCIFILLIASIFTLYRLASFILNYKKLVNVHNFYKYSLKITTYDLQTMKWSHIINKISKNVNLTIYEITNIILKKQNYLLSLINNIIINVPNKLYTKQLEINLKLIILNDLEKDISESELARKFILYGFGNLFLSIFIFIYLLLYYFVTNIDEIYSNSKTSPVGSRRYTLLAKRKFKHYISTTKINLLLL